MCVCLRAELAEIGFAFCTESLEAKLQKHKETAVEDLTGETPATQQTGPGRPDR